MLAIAILRSGLPAFTHTVLDVDITVTQEEFDAWLADRFEQQGNEFNLEEDPNLEVWNEWQKGAKK